MSKKISLDEILDGFNPNEGRGSGPRAGTSLTLWVPTELKERYDRVQAKSGRRFSAKIRELVEAAIALAEQRAS